MLIKFILLKEKTIERGELLYVNPSYDNKTVSIPKTYLKNFSFEHLLQAFEKDSRCVGTEIEEDFQLTGIILTISDPSTYDEKEIFDLLTPKQGNAYAYDNKRHFSTFNRSGFNSIVIRVWEEERDERSLKVGEKWKTRERGINLTVLLNNELKKFTGPESLSNFFDVISNQAKQEKGELKAKQTKLMSLETVLFTDRKEKKKWEIKKETILKRIKQRKSRFFVSNLDIFILALFSLYPIFEENFSITGQLIHNGSIYFCKIKDHRTKEIVELNCANKIIPFFFEQEQGDDELELKGMTRTLNEMHNQLSPIDKYWFLHDFSISAISISLFKKIMGEEKAEKILKSEVRIHRKFQPGFFGGRNEVYGNALEGEEIFHFDFSNMHGEILKEDFPSKEFREFEEGGDVKEGEMGFFWTKVKSTQISIPFLPHRNTNNWDNENNWENLRESEIIVKDGIFHTNGEFEGLYWSECLEMFPGEEKGEITKNGPAFVFDRKSLSPIFKEFINFCIKKRDEAKNETQRIIWKLIIVSFFGRLGMGEFETETRLISNENYRKLSEKQKNVIIHEKFIQGSQNWRLIESKKENRGNEIIKSEVIYAAIVTARARIKLQKAIRAAEKAGGRVLYVATDSLFVAFKRDVTGEKHGEITWEKQKDKTLRIEEAIFASTGIYATREKNKEEVKIIGTRRNSISFDDFKEYFYRDGWKPISEGKGDIFDDFGILRFPFINELDRNLYKTRKNQIKHSHWNLSHSLKKELHQISEAGINSYDKRVFDQAKKRTKPLFRDKGKYFADPFTEWK